MHRLTTSWCCALAAVLMLIAAALDSARGAGALAVGRCAAFGYAYDYGSDSGARAAALNQCNGGRCEVVAIMARSCAALAIDGHRACGPHGYAVARRLGQAENTALRYCYKYGGRDCVIRAWACDAKG